MIKYYTPYKLYSIPDGFFVTEQVRMNTAGMEKGEFIPLLSHSSVKSGIYMFKLYCIFQ